MWPMTSYVWIFCSLWTDGHTWKVSPQSVQPLQRRRFLKVFFESQYGCRITWPMMSWKKNLWTILSLHDPQNFSYWSDVAFYVCNYDVIMKAPLTSCKNHTYFQWGSTSNVPSFNFFHGAVSEIQWSTVFLFQHGCHTTWPMTSYVLILKHFTGVVAPVWRFCVNPTSGCREKPCTRCVQTDKQNIFF